MGLDFPFCKLKRVLETDGGCITDVNVLKAIELYT